MVTGRPINHLGIRRTLLFDSTPLHRDLFDLVLEMDPSAFDGFIDPLFESEDHVSKGREELGREFSHKILRGFDDLVLVSLEEDASSSKSKTGHIKRDCKGVNIGNKANGSGIKDDDVAWLNIVSDNIGSAFMSTSKLNDSILWHARLGHVHYKRMQDMSKDGLIPAFNMDTEKAVVRLLDPKLKTLGKRGIECIFIRYAEHSKAFRFYVIKPNDSVSINSIIESRDAIFDKNRFSSVHRPRTRDEVTDQHSYCFNVEDDPKTFDKAMQYQDVAFWKEEINDEMDSTLGNNTWVLADLPPSCKPLGCKWIFKRKLKVDGTIKNFKARLVIQVFRQNSRIDYFDTYALVVLISTIRLLIDMASIHNLVIHQIDVKIDFLNGKLDEEFSMKDMGQADVILGIRIKHESNWIAISQSHYIEKVLKKFNYFDCTLMSTHMDTSEKLMPNNGQAISQLKYSRVQDVKGVMDSTEFLRQFKFV
ncbi:zinc finger, CCHC-type containing protein [Tanacetum coccineum]